jgi:hypothetical protein
VLRVLTWSLEPGGKSSSRTPPSTSDCTTLRFISSLRLGCGRNKLEEFSKENLFPLDALRNAMVANEGRGQMSFGMTEPALCADLLLNCQLIVKRLSAEGSIMLWSSRSKSAPSAGVRAICDPINTKPRSFTCPIRRGTNLDVRHLGEQ